MGRFRRFVKKALKPFIMAGVAGTVAVSLVVTTPSNAQAFVPPPVLPAIFGATEMVLPELMATGSLLGPWGWGIAAVGALGVGLYNTRDYWVPYVTGTFGKQATDGPAGTFDQGVSGTFPTASPSPTASASPSPSPTTAGKVAQPDGSITLKNSRPSADGRTIFWDQTFVATAGSFTNFAFGFKLQCKMDGGWGADAQGMRYNEQTSPSGQTSPGTITRSLGCKWSDNYGDHYGQVVGFVAGSPGLDGLAPFPSNWSGALRSPGNTTTFGNFAPRDIDPRTDKTKYTTTVECIANDGTRASISAESLGGAGGLTIPSCAAAGLGHGTGKIHVDGFLDGSTTPTPVWDAKPPTPDPAMPLCDPSRPGQGCKLGLKLDNQECVMGLFACANWAELSKDPNWTPRYSCEYGPYVVALAVCTPLEKGYQPGGAPATNPNTDGDPKTGDNTGPDGKPDPGPNNTPTTTGTPGAGGQPNPNADPKGKECFPTGWGVFNPLEWVMKPVGCALTAAFVPTNTVVQAQTTRIQDKIKNAGPGKVIAAWQTTFNSVGGGSGCAGPPVTFSMEGYAQTMRPFDACSGGMATAASISFAVSSVMIVIFGGLGIARAASSAFGFNLGFGKGSSE